LVSPSGALVLENFVKAILEPVEGARHDVFAAPFGPPSGVDEIGVDVRFKASNL
jgi:hypothetical protein